MKDLVKQSPATPLKQRDLMKCVVCRRGVMHSNQLNFYRVTFSSYMVNLQEVRKQTGLEMITGHPALAQILGPDGDLAVPIRENQLTVHLCQHCIGLVSLAEVYERGYELISQEASDEERSTISQEAT